MSFDDDGIGRLLGDVPPPSEDYPKELLLPTRAEFVTMVKKHPNNPKNKPGCKLFWIILICAIPALIGGIIQIITMLF